MKASECKWFNCLYATRSFCSIRGYFDSEGKFNGKKEWCRIYDVMCISAKCSMCSRENVKDVCPHCDNKELS